MLILEHQEADRYEAWCYVGGAKFHIEVQRDPVAGWPPDFQKNCHRKLREAVKEHTRAKT